MWDKVNSAKPLWMRTPKDVSKEEYDEFYKTTFKAYDTPDAYTHFSLEGQASAPPPPVAFGDAATTRLPAPRAAPVPPSDARTWHALPQVEFRALLFLPSTVPWELSQDMFNEKVKAVKLFVKRVFISDSFEEQLLPRWLSFLKGVVRLPPPPHRAPTLHPAPTLHLRRAARSARLCALACARASAPPRPWRPPRSCSALCVCLGAGGFGRPAAQCLARDPPEVARALDHLEAPRAQVARHVQGDRTGRGEVRHLHQEVTRPRPPARPPARPARPCPVRRAPPRAASRPHTRAALALTRRSFGRYIKVGLIEDKDNKDALLKLASFASSDASIGERGTTIPEYKERMKEGQKQIYYISGSTKAAAMASPVLDRLKQKGCVAHHPSPDSNWTPTYMHCPPSPPPPRARC